jgi:hypothetical protein
MNHQENTGDNNRVRIVKIWLNAFIPKDLDSAQPVPGTKHSGKTMLPTPGPMNAWFLTDQRGFSSDNDVSSRMHSEIEIDIMKQQIARELHQCWDSVQVDSENGEEQCRDAADTTEMAFSHFQVAHHGRAFSLDLKAASKNPCLKFASMAVSPNLDYEGKITITVDEDYREALVTFEGKIETYPAFECYVSANGGPPQTLFLAEVVPGTNPLNLVGPPVRPMSVRVMVTASGK